ncbi:MAG: FtsW/RodA/SpoVE family cell cycle protein, partial [Candidatus Promineifilaceae bacterium]|nr:FtsW/RodA/SpoVE family cell cycle protein [Candidatus Promineifilaceae bacterium]
SDFVFAAIIEEWGVIGSLAVVAAMALLLSRGMVAAQRARRPFDMYLAAGISAMIGVQTIMIMGGVTKLLPLTGVTLPLVSYGGSSLVVTAMMIGLLLNISSRPARTHR